MKYKIGNQEYYMDTYLKTNLDRAKKIVTKDWDMIILVDGYEGSGKSVLAMQSAFYFDTTLDLDRICFTPKEFKTGVLKAQPFQAIIYDEAYTGLTSRAAMSLINQTLVKMLAEIRQKQLFVVIVMPTFFDLDKYVALWRSRALIHVYTKNSFDRGYFAFYNADRKKSLFVNGKKFYNYFRPDPNFRGRFMNDYPIDEAKYRAKKRESLLHKSEIDDEALDPNKLKQEIFNRVVDMPKMTNTLKANIIGVDRGTFTNWVEKRKEDLIERAETAEFEGFKPSTATSSGFEPVTSENNDLTTQNGKMFKK